jgi:hypothetical protein
MRPPAMNPLGFLEFRPLARGMGSDRLLNWPRVAII